MGKERRGGGIMKLGVKGGEEHLWRCWSYNACLIPFSNKQVTPH